MTLAKRAALDGPNRLLGPVAGSHLRCGRSLPSTYRILRRGYTKGLILAFHGRHEHRDRPERGHRTLGGPIALMFATQSRLPMCAIGVQADRRSVWIVQFCAARTITQATCIIMLLAVLLAG
jgi:hypothetical protein